MLAGAYGALRQTDKAVQYTKEYITKYGGDSLQLAYVGSNALAKKNFAEAESYGLKAMEKAKAEGKKPNPDHYNMVLAAYRDSGKMDQYYNLLERAATMFNSETYWRPFVERAKKEPKFRPDDGLLDVYRTLRATNVKLNTTEQKEMGDVALNNNLPLEAEAELGALFKAGALGGASDPQADRNKRYFERAKSDAATMKAGLAKLETDAAAKVTGDEYVRIGQAYMTLGDNKKAIEVINKGLAKGGMEPGDTELAKLRLGIAQFRAGDKETARKTWSDIKADNGAAWLAKVWVAKSKT
jgi:tetratricopeptide (TPR) repeat protein